MYNDKNLTCADCGQEFVFTASEQDFYAQRGFTEPRRCPSCRASRKAARNAEGGGSSYGGYGAGGGYSAGGSSYGGVRLRAPATAVPARCSRPPARPAARKPRSRSARPAASRSTAATASGPSAEADHPSRCGPTHGPPNQPRPRPGPSADPGRSILGLSRGPRGTPALRARPGTCRPQRRCRSSAHHRSSLVAPVRVLGEVPLIDALAVDEPWAHAEHRAGRRRPPESTRTSRRARRPPGH